MNKESLKAYLENLIPSGKFEEICAHPVLIIDKNDLLKTCRQLKEDKEMLFDFLLCETAVDRNTHFEVIYHLKSTVFLHKAVVKVILERQEMPEIESVYSLWQAAELFENEIFDLFGIKFLNHPKLRRIFLGDEWKGFPLRKDYKDETNVVPL